MISNTQQDIKDICLELTDNGFEYRRPNLIDEIVHLEIWKPRDVFKYNEIEDVTERLIDYLTKLGYDWVYTATKSDGHMVIFKSENIHRYSITFKSKQYKK